MFASFSKLGSRLPPSLLHLVRLIFQFPPIRAGIKGMDTSNPSVFVNGELLRLYIGRKVRTVFKVTQSEGGVARGKTTDEHDLMVKGLPPSVPPTSYIEVIGIAESNQSIKADIWTNFGNTFDVQSYNQLCLLANGEFKSLFI